MKKTIVALYGSSSRGKSTALKTFIHQLKKNKNFDFVKLDDNYSNEKYDIVAIFDYNGIKIGISTAGDIKEIIKKRVETCLIKKHDCKIIFTASRSRRGTVSTLEEISKENKFKLEWIEKLYRIHDPIKESIGTDNNIHLDKITELEVDYLMDYLINYLLK
ncbi:hypothetical protein [Aggregatibacter segnis]|uniref:hypothetical protein n=1 Tax=Aggregatibacter segnis TaxID=739 RepID=UPI00288C3A53|nr:hypothetical protein [Aggregatibacter segnis]